TDGIHRLVPNPAGDKSWNIICNHYALTELVFSESLRFIDRLFRSVFKRNDFHKLHNPWRVKEMHSKESSALFFTQYFRDISNRYTGSVRRKQCITFGNTLHLIPHFMFDFQLFLNGFNEDIRIILPLQ